MAEDEERYHNKSHKTEMGLYSASRETIVKVREAFDTVGKHEVEGLCRNSFCQKVNISDGRLSVERKKVCYAYQFVAFERWPGIVLPAVKARNSLVISHLCGTEHCIQPSHLHIETKCINDERTHCHFVMKNYKDKHGGTQMPLDIVKDFCPHEPVCGSHNDRPAEV